jgi:hypothetical protein
VGNTKISFYSKSIEIIIVKYLKSHVYKFLSTATRDKRTIKNRKKTRKKTRKIKKQQKKKAYSSVNN